jgi:hypothetical protein
MSEHAETSERAPLDDGFLDRIFAEAADRRRRRRAEHAASGRPIGHLDLMPSCAVCDAGLDYDDDHFVCHECGITWDRYGENPQREEADDAAS